MHSKAPTQIKIEIQLNTKNLIHLLWDDLILFNLLDRDHWLLLREHFHMYKFRSISAAEHQRY